MKLMTFNCKIFNSEVPGDYSLGQIFIDVDMVSAFHSAEDSDFTIIYIDGYSHEIQIESHKFGKIKCNTLHLHNN